MTERMRDMIEMHGEVCTMTQAAKIVSRSDETIRRMIQDGRLRAACEGTMVDVRSIAEYIERPKQADGEARVAKKRAKAGRECRWSV